jgi:acyl-CoA synthetase (NDP forming)
MPKLSESATEKLLRKFRIPIPERYLAHNEEHAVLYAHKAGYPVVLKVSSSDILHKTDIGCVMLDLQNEDQVRHGFDRIMANARKHDPSARIEGVLVQKMIEGKDIREVIIGGKRDPQFGPVIMFGLGGIFVESMKDVSFRLIPITRKEARGMIAEIKAREVLEGVRGQRPVDFRLLENVLLKVSNIMVRVDEINELDINPLLVDDSRVVAIDTKVVTR